MSRVHPDLWAVHADALARLAAGELTNGAEDHRTAMSLRALLGKGLAAREIKAPVGAVWSVTPAGLAWLASRAANRARYCAWRDEAAAAVAAGR